MKAEKAWFSCRREMHAKGINVDETLPWDINCKDIMLDEPELRAAAEVLQAKGLADNPYEELVADAIFWNCVTVEPGTFYISSDNIRQYLGLNVGYQ
jgi:hypothetical protein